MRLEGLGGVENLENRRRRLLFERYNLEINAYGMLKAKIPTYAPIATDGEIGTISTKKSNDCHWRNGS